MVSNPFHILAVDIGTGSSRGLIIDSELNILSTHSVNNYLHEPFPGWVEQNPDEVYKSTLQVIHQAIDHADKRKIKIDGICFSAAVSSLFAVDSAGNPLCYALTWADSRSRTQVEQLRERQEWLYRRTGAPLHATYWPAKLLWMQQNQRDLIPPTRLWMGIKEYVIGQLTGNFLFDFSSAAATGMMNLDTLQWEPEVCTLAGISIRNLPPVRPTTTIIQNMKPEILRELGMKEQVPIILGSGDGMLANLGSGVIESGQIATTIGSSGACRRMSDHPVFDQSMRIWSYPLLDHLWVVGGANDSGGLVVDWFQKRFFPQLDPSDKKWLQEAESIPPGSNGLIFLPYLFGERAPLWNESARGAFIGLDHFHTTRHMTRALLEGTIFALYDIYEAVSEGLESVKDIRISGGYAQSAIWVDIQSNMFNRDLTVLENSECSAIGAGMLGFYALGMVDRLEDLTKFIKTRRIIQPSDKLAAQYKSIIPLYKDAYQALAPILEELQRFRNVTPDNNGNPAAGFKRNINETQSSISP